MNDMAILPTVDEDVARLMRHAHDLERKGRKMDAEIIYTAASEIARMRLELRQSSINGALPWDFHCICGRGYFIPTARLGEPKCEWACRTCQHDLTATVRRLTATPSLGEKT